MTGEFVPRPMSEWTEADLAPEGERVNPDMIRDGLMTETPVIYRGRVRYVVGVTPAGVAAILARVGAGDGGRA